MAAKHKSKVLKAKAARVVALPAMANLESAIDDLESFNALLFRLQDAGEQMSHHDDHRIFESLGIIVDTIVARLRHAAGLEPAAGGAS